MEIRSLGYRTDLLVRRLAGSEVVDMGDHIVVRTPANPDFYWGTFLLVAAPVAPGDGRRWLALFSAEFPRADHVAIGIDGTGGDAGDISEFLKVGMAMSVNTVLTASDLHAPARPHPDATCRALTTDDDWEQATALRVAVASDGGQDSAEHRRFLEDRIDEARRLVESGTAAHFGAFVDGRLWSSLGLVADGAGLACLQDVETHPAGRRRGLAGTLVHAAGLHGLRHLGARTVVIVADPDGPATGLYQSLGFVGTERQVELLRPAHARDTPAERPES